jgi:hypothetical protein
MTTQRIPSGQWILSSPMAPGSPSGSRSIWHFKCREVDSLNTHQKRKEEPGWGEPALLRSRSLRDRSTG